MPRTPRRSDVERIREAIACVARWVGGCVSSGQAERILEIVEPIRWIDGGGRLRLGVVGCAGNG